MKIQLVDIQETFEDYFDELVSFAEKKVSDVKKVVWPEDTLNAFLNRGQSTEKEQTIKSADSSNPDIVVNVSRDSELADGLENISVENAEQTSLLERISQTLNRIWDSDERQRRKDARKIEKTIDPTIEANSFVKQPPKETGGLLGMLGGLADMFSGPAEILDDVFDRRKRTSGPIDVPDTNRRQRRRRSIPIPDADIGSNRKKSGRTINRDKYNKQPKVSESTDMVVRDKVDADFPDNPDKKLPAHPYSPKHETQAKPRGRFGRIIDTLGAGAGFIRDNIGTIAGVGSVVAGGVVLDSAMEKYGFGGILPESAKDTESELKAERESAAQKLQEARDKYDSASNISDEKERMRQTILAEVEINKQRDAINKIDKELEDRKEEFAKRDAALSQLDEATQVAKEVVVPESEFPTTEALGLGVAALGGTAYAMQKRKQVPDVEDAVDVVPMPDVEKPKAVETKPSADVKAVTPDVEAKAPKPGLGSSVKSGAKALTRGSAIGTLVSGAMLFADINEQRSQEYESEEAKDKDTAKLVGGFAGESSAVIAGGLAGAAIGSVVPVVGTAIGGLVGSAAGYLASQELGLSELGEEAAVKLYDIGKDVSKQASEVVGDVSGVVSNLTNSITGALSSAFSSVSDFFGFATESEKEQAENQEEVQKKEMEAALEMRDLLEEKELDAEPGWSLFGKDPSPAQQRPTLPQFGPSLPNSPTQKSSNTRTYRNGGYIEQTPKDQQDEFNAAYTDGATYNLDSDASDVVETPRDRALIFDPDEQRASNEKVVSAITNMQTTNNTTAAAPAAKAVAVHKASAPDSKRNNIGGKPSLSNIPVSSDDASIMLINSGM